MTANVEFALAVIIGYITFFEQPIIRVNRWRRSTPDQ